MTRDHIITRLVVEDPKMTEKVVDVLRRKETEYKVVEDHFDRVRFLEQNMVTQFVRESTTDDLAKENF